MKRIISSTFSLTAIIAVMMFSSCKKDTVSTPEEPDGFQNLETPQDFSWSTLNKTSFTITVTDLDGQPSDALNGFPLDATDMQGNRLQRASVIDGQAPFYLEINNSITEIKITSPSHGITKTINLNDAVFNFPVSELKSTKSYTDSDNDGVYDEFDDFPEDPEVAYLVEYPSPYRSNFKSGQGDFTIWYYQIYEDLWPSKGDYDFNDLVLKVKMYVEQNGANKWKKGTFDMYVWANGAGLQLGFGLDYFKYNGSSGGKDELEYLPDGSISLEDGNYVATGITHIDSEIENGIIVCDNVNAIKASPYYNTGTGNSANPMESHVSVSWEIQNPTEMRIFTYLFRTNDRSHEIRSFGLPPTEAMDMSLLGTGEDNSPTSWSWTPGNTFDYPLADPFFATANLHPWGIEVEWDGDLKVAFERTSILDAFPQFQIWAESGGSQNTEWYKNPSSDPTLVFDVSSLVP